MDHWRLEIRCLDASLNRYFSKGKESPQGGLECGIVHEHASTAGVIGEPLNRKRQQPRWSQKVTIWAIPIRPRLGYPEVQYARDGWGRDTRAKDLGWLRNQHPANAEGITGSINDRRNLLVTELRFVAHIVATRDGMLGEASSQGSSGGIIILGRGSDDLGKPCQLVRIAALAQSTSRKGVGSAKTRGQDQHHPRRRSSAPKPRRADGCSSSDTLIADFPYDRRYRRGRMWNSGIEGYPLPSRRKGVQHESRGRP
jgi:hypothetical protein